MSPVGDSDAYLNVRNTECRENFTPCKARAFGRVEERDVSDGYPYFSLLRASAQKGRSFKEVREHGEESSLPRYPYLGICSGLFLGWPTSTKGVTKPREHLYCCIVQYS